MKNNLELKGKERIVASSNLEIDVIDENIKTYQNTTNFVQEKLDTKHEVKEKEEVETENYEKISILDLLGDDF